MTTEMLLDALPAHLKNDVLSIQFSNFYQLAEKLNTPHYSGDKEQHFFEINFNRALTQDECHQLLSLQFTDGYLYLPLFNSKIEMPIKTASVILNY